MHDWKTWYWNCMTLVLTETWRDHIEATLEFSWWYSNCWSIRLCQARSIVCHGCFFFFLRTFFRVCLWLGMTVLLGSLQAHDWHEGHEGQKSRAQVSLGRGGEATGGRRVWRGFRQELAPVDGIGVDVVEIRCSFTKKGGCEGGHGCMCQRGGPSCGESGRYALLEDGGCLSGSGSCQVGDEGGSLLTPSAPHLYGKHDQTAALVVEEVWVGSFFASAGIL